MRGKPRVEAGVKFVQGNFFAGETFLDLADARARMAGWLAVANARVHATTRQCSGMSGSRPRRFTRRPARKT